MPSTDTRPLAVVTGASSGIGLELARQFAGNGFDLIVSAEDADLEIAAAELRGRGARIDAARLDLTTDEGVDALYELIKQTGRPVAALSRRSTTRRGRSCSRSRRRCATSSRTRR
jgi:uncharacterized protein